MKCVAVDYTILNYLKVTLLEKVKITKRRKKNWVSLVGPYQLGNLTFYLCPTKSMERQPKRADGSTAWGRGFADTLPEAASTETPAPSCSPALRPAVFTSST